MAKEYRVYNNDKSAVFVTNDQGLAYEVRKGADTNCYDEDGIYSKEGAKFCELYSGTEDCTLEVIETDEVEKSQLIEGIYKSNKFTIDEAHNGFVIAKLKKNQVFGSIVTPTLTY